MTKEIDLKEQRKLQVQGLSYIKKICDENEIPYFLANGTVMTYQKIKEINISNKSVLER